LKSYWKIEYFCHWTFDENERLNFLGKLRVHSWFYWKSLNEYGGCIKPGLQFSDLWCRRSYAIPNYFCNRKVNKNQKNQISKQLNFTQTDILYIYLQYKQQELSTTYTICALNGTGPTRTYHIYLYILESQFCDQHRKLHTHNLNKKYLGISGHKCIFKNVFWNVQE
jgi:hypothetical protein